MILLKVKITSTAATMNHAKTELFEYLKTICNNEIYQNVINSEKEKEIRV